MSEDNFTSDDDSVSICKVSKKENRKSKFGKEKPKQGNSPEVAKDAAKKKDYKFPQSLSEFEKSKSLISTSSVPKIKGVRENSKFAFPGSGGFRTEENLDQVGEK
jgi:hypothetical protein